MTTTVTIAAHCSSTKRVVVQMKVSEVETHEAILQDGEKLEQVVYDDRVLEVREVLKGGG